MVESQMETQNGKFEISPQKESQSIDFYSNPKIFRNV